MILDNRPRSRRIAAPGGPRIATHATTDKRLPPSLAEAHTTAGAAYIGRPPLKLNIRHPRAGISPLPVVNTGSRLRRTKTGGNRVVHAVIILEISMNTSVSISLTKVDETSRRNLPPGVVHIGDVARLVLAARGLSLGDEPEADRPVVAAGANDFFDVSIAALESVLVG